MCAAVTRPEQSDEGPFLLVRGRRASILAKPAMAGRPTMRGVLCKHANDDKVPGLIAWGVPRTPLVRAYQRRRSGSDRRLHGLDGQERRAGLKRGRHFDA